MPSVKAVQARLAWLLVFLSLAALYLPNLVKHARFAAEPLIFNDDSRQFVWPFVMDRRKNRPRDVQYDYRKAGMPPGYKALYGGWTAFGDPRTLSKILPYALLVLLLAAAAHASFRLGGIASAWASMGLILSSGVFLERLTGGHPRAFAFPLTACLLAALVAGKTRLLAALCVVSAAFYPVTSALGGAIFLLWMTLGPKDLGEASGRPPRARARMVAATAALSCLLMSPSLLSMRRFQPLMRATDISSYPEYGPDGRYAEEADRPPYGSFWGDAVRQTALSLKGEGRPWSAPLRRWGWPHRFRFAVVLLLLVLAGSIRLGAQDAGARRLLYLPLLLLTLHTFSKLLAPAFYLPQRYLQYSIPLLAALLIPAGLSALPLFLKNEALARRLRPVLPVLFFSAHALLYGGRGDPQVGFHIQIPRGDWVFPFLATLPTDSVIAGWPGPQAAIDSVPYVSARTAFLTFENHETYHRAYADIMRERARALIDAYYAFEPGPIERLRDEHGVTHLLLDPRHFQDKPAVYFKPFNRWAREAFKRAQKNGGFLAPRLAARAAVFNDGRRIVLDLSRLPHARPPE